MSVTAASISRKSLVERLWVEQGRAIARMARERMGNDADADDLMQDLFVFLCLFEGEVPTADNKKALLGWVKGCMIRISSNHWRAERRRRAREAGASHPAHADNPGAVAATSERRRAVAGAIGSLPPSEASIVRDLLIDGSTYADTAARRGQSIPEVRKTEGSAINRLSRRLRQFKPIAWILSILGFPSARP